MIFLASSRRLGPAILVYIVTVMIENRSQCSVRTKVEASENDNQWMGNLTSTNRNREGDLSEDKFTSRSQIYIPQDTHSKYGPTREMANKNIELNALRESYEILKSENESLNLILRDKEAMIEEYKGVLEDLQSQNDKISRYESSICESNGLLRNIESEVERLTEECNEKEKLLEESRGQVDSFIARNKDYETKINSLSKEFQRISEEKRRMQVLNQDLERNMESFKEKYLSASRRIEQMPELEIRLKSVTSINVELENRIRGLIQTNESLKVEFSESVVSHRRHTQLESDREELRRAAEDKDSEIGSMREALETMRVELLRLREYRDNNTNLEEGITTKSREIRAMKQRNEELQGEVSGLQKDILKMVEEKSKIAERNEKIDQLFKENRHLVGLSKDKINAIQSLQYEVNRQSCQITSLTHQNQRLNEKEQELRGKLQEVESYQLDARKSAERLEMILKESEEQLEYQKSKNSQLSGCIQEEKASSKRLLEEKQQLKRELSSINDKCYGLESLRIKLESQLSSEKARNESALAEIVELRETLEVSIVREREQHGSIRLLGIDKHNLEERVNILTSNTQALRQQAERMEKWKSLATRLLDSFSQTNERMHRDCQQLMTE